MKLSFRQVSIPQIITALSPSRHPVSLFYVLQFANMLPANKYINLQGPTRANRTISMLSQPRNQLPKSLTTRLNTRRGNKQWLNNSNLIEKLSIPMSAVCRDNLMDEYEQHERQFNGGSLPIPASDLDSEAIAGGLSYALWECRCDTFREVEKVSGELTAWF
jgi:hypothetical protein